MASRYWVGGTAAWDGTAGTKWALTSGGAGGQAIPTSADDVFFTNLSTGTCTISTGNTGAKSITCTGFVGTLTLSAAISVAGNITFVSGMTLSGGSIVTVTASCTLISGTKNFNLTVSGGTLTQGDALTNTSRSISVGSGATFDTASFSLTCSIMVGASATVNLNASAVTITSDWNINGGTVNAGTSTITLTSTVPVFTGGGKTYNNVSFTGAAGTISIAGINTFNTLTITSIAAAGILKCSFSANQTITTLVANGATIIRRLMLQSDSIGTARTLTVGTYTTKQNVDFRDITAAGVSSPWSGTGLGNCLGNTSITFSAAKTVYWNLTGTRMWTATAWATTSGGVPALANFPLAQDTAVLDNAGAATSIGIDNYINVGTFDSSTRTTAVTISQMIGVEIYGNFTNGTGVTITAAAALPAFSGRSTQTLTSAGESFSSINSASPLCVVSLADAFTTTGASQGISFQFGASFNANSYNVTVYNLSVQSTGSLNIGTAVWTIFGTGFCWNVAGTTTLTGSAEIILSDTSTTARTFAGGGKTYGKLTIGGATGISTTSISGANTFAEIASTKTVAHTIEFPIATTTVAAFTVSGTSGNVVTLSRTGASGVFTLTKTGVGVVSSNYLSISNSTATPTLTWYAGANSTDGGGNTGWIFANAPTASGNFLMMFM